MADLEFWVQSQRLTKKTDLASIPTAVHLHAVLILWILILLDHSVKVLFWAIWLGPFSVQKPPPLCQTDLSYLIAGDAGPPATYQQATSSVDRAQAQKRYIGCLFCEVGPTQSLFTTNSTHQTLSSSSK